MIRVKFQIHQSEIYRAGYGPYGRKVTAKIYESRLRISHHVHIQL